MIDLDPFYQALRKRIVGAAPQLLPPGGGVAEGEQASMIPWDQLDIPFAAIVIPPETREPLTMDSLLYECIVDVYYIDAIEGNSAPIRGPLRAIATDLYPDTGDVPQLDYGQIEDIASLPQYSDSLFPNQLFRQRNSQHRAGRLQLKCLLG